MTTTNAPVARTKLTLAEFRALPEYSCSVPTGTEIGKRWKRRIPYHGEPCEWFLGEYVEPDAEQKEKGQVGIQWTRIEVAELAKLVLHLERQREWSLRTFGHGARTRGVLDHILKELAEIEQAPLDIEEWIDVVILAFDGAMRVGATPVAIVETLLAKQAKNEARKWPDWRTQDPNKAIEHDRTSEVIAQ